MSEKREHASTGSAVSDGDIDRAARSLLAASPSPYLSEKVAERLRETRADTPALVPLATLRRWQLAFASLALLLVAAIAWVSVRQAPPPASSTARALQPPATRAVPPAAVAQSSPAPSAPDTSAHGAPQPAASSPPRDSARAGFTRVAGPRLAGRVATKPAEPRARWDLSALGQPEKGALDPVPDVAPIPPLPKPLPVVIPPIIIPELIITPLRWGWE